MARPNLVRSWVLGRRASLLAVVVVAGVVVAPLAAGAIDNQYVDVKVFETYFDPATVLARPGDMIRFTLQPGASHEHSVTLENATCADRPNRLCERTFEDTNTITFRFSQVGTYPYYDRFAQSQGNDDMRGTIVITEGSTTTTTQPTTTTTTVVPSSSTTTTGPTTTTTTPEPATTTTAPTPIRPQGVGDPVPTTTTRPAPAMTATGGGAAPKASPPASAPAKANDKGKGDKGKAKGAATETPATASAPADAPPADVVFDSASLTPGFVMMPDASATDSDDEAALDTSAVVSLLNPEKSGDGTGRLLLIAGVALAVLCLVGAGCAWYYRSSSYDPA